MADLINDGSLIGLWPLYLEPSGSPTWKNYSPAYSKHPSGISFDFHVHCADLNSTTDDDAMASTWPGTARVFNHESGVWVRGLQLNGQNQRLLSNTSAPYSKMLVLGNGTYVQRTETLAPAIANSGFTAGIWVYPISDGWLDANNGGFSTTTDSWFTGFGRVHALMSQARDDIGWYIGVSGALAGATQFNSSKEGGPHQLRGYLLCDVPSSSPLELDTPIESGRFTHLTMTYRYVDGTSNEIVLYKDGRVTASGITNRNIVIDATSTVGPDASVLNLGGSNDGSYGNDAFEFTSGWGHLVSGAYHLRRVLHEGEILEMHERGGLQPDYELRNDTQEVLITDNSLVAYIDQRAPGWVDSSKNHYHLHSQKDPGDRNSAFTWDPGPHNSNRNYNDGNNLFECMAVPSGACFSLAQAEGGFTILGHFMPIMLPNDRDSNMMMSWGSVSTATIGPASATVSTNTMGLCLTYYSQVGFGDRIALEIFPVGDLTNGALTLRTEGEQVWRTCNQHYAIVYDAASQGIALYFDGYQAASGTLTHNLQDQLVRLAGSGFPLMFQNGITNDNPNQVAHGVHANGGRFSSSGPFAMLSRPLLASEIRAIAQSGINTTSLWRTRQDVRLMGYWPCDTIDNGDFAIEDKARAMSPILAHLNRGESLVNWDRVYSINDAQPAGSVFRDDGTAFVDFYAVRSLPPELASYGNLGLTSGTFTPIGGSFAAGPLAANNDTNNTPYNLVARYKPATEERDLGPQNLHEYIIAFEVTPSGNIPALEIADQSTNITQRLHNSRLHTYGNISTSTADGESYSMLTTLNAENPDPLGAEAGTGGSGVTIAFVGRDGSSITSSVPIISGTLPYGVPSRVLLHAKFDEPYRATSDVVAGQSPMTITLWIDGQKANQRTAPCTDFRLWSDTAPFSTTDDWLLSFGGSYASDTAAIQVTTETGLGEIYMREIFVMRGVFETNEVAALAASGINNNSITGYTSQVPTTQVTIADSTLEGYWRFNGFDGNIGEVSNSPGGSGTTDLSSKNNHLNAIAQVVYEQGVSCDMAETLRALPGPHINSTLGVQCSGFHNQSRAAQSTEPNLGPPFAVSGAAFDTPHAGFSVGFWLSKRDNVITNRFDTFLSYGGVTAGPNGNAADPGLDPSRGWVIGMDDGSNIKMVMSTAGNMYLQDIANAANSGQIVCGFTNTGNVLRDERSFNNYQQGDFTIPSHDAWVHCCWTYDPQPDAGQSGIRCYVNGVLVDERFIQPHNSDGTPILNPWTGTPIAPQVPSSPDSRIISIRSPQSTVPWNFQQLNLVDFDSVITDLFYFSRAITEAEVRYIALYGIDDSTGTGVFASGLAGGYVRGQDTGSGTIGGYFRGQESGSGLMGGFVPGSTLGSGSIGGYVSGVVFGDGTIGGWLRGLDTASGVFAGYIFGVGGTDGTIASYIRGQEVGSGYFGGIIFGTLDLDFFGQLGGYVAGSDQTSGVAGGFILGGLRGLFEFDSGFTIEALSAKDFDAQLEITKTVSSDFDAKVIIFQNEQPPYVDIPIPETTVTGLVPPFNQYFIGYASGTQGKTITSTKWTFGDFTPSVVGTQSGSVHYPVQHAYASSGFFVAKFEAIDSNGLHASATRIINVASGIDPVIITLSGVPRSGNAELIVDFVTTVDILPPGVTISARLLDFDDGQKTTSFNPTHNYTEPGTYKPLWAVRDSRGVIWTDSLESGSDILGS